MATTETGHAKIMANFDRLVESVFKMGKDYSPSNPALWIEALQNASINCRKALDTVGTAAVSYRTAVKQREAAFEPVKKTASRIYNTLKASDRSGKSDETASLYVRKIQGRRAEAKRTEEEKKADMEAGIQYTEVSASQQSYDNQVENFGLLVKLASVTPAYAPNEADLKIESLMILLEDLKKKNSAVISATSDLYKARALRNYLMYKDVTGLVDIAMDAKTYLKGAFGVNSFQYKEVAGLAFRKAN